MNNSKISISGVFIKVKKAIAKFHISKSPLYLLAALILLCSHDLYIKMETYFLEPNEQATLSLFNGTFEKSENIITRDRMIDASIVANGTKRAINSDSWSDKDSTITQLNFITGDAGTYVAGVATKARNIELTSEKFNDYLRHDGVLDVLNQRTKDGLLNQDAVESYQKHVKAIYQVGDTKTEDWKTVLGYPIEFVPQTNPYEKYSGETLDIQLLLDGKPLTNQLVYANYLKTSHTTNSHQHTNGEDHSHLNTQTTLAKGKEHEDEEHTHSQASNSKKEHTHKHEHADSKESHSHEHTHGNEEHTHSSTPTSENVKSQGHSHNHKEKPHSNQAEAEEAHTHTSGQQLRTDEQGIVTVDLPEDGIYYIRTIYMTTVEDDASLTHQSKWSTLTFEVTHKHDATTHSHDDEDSIPTWVFILGSLLVVGILFFVFRKTN